MSGWVTADPFTIAIHPNSLQVKEAMKSWGNEASSRSRTNLPSAHQKR